MAQRDSKQLEKNKNRRKVIAMTHKLASRYQPMNTKRCNITTNRCKTTTIMTQKEKLRSQNKT